MNDAQPPLFPAGDNGDDDDEPDLSSDPRSRARRDDPETSKAGARSVSFRENTQKAKLLVAYLAADPQPLMDIEAAWAAGIRTDRGACYWKRVGELVDDHGLLVEAGEARSPLTGERVRTCELTDSGRAAARKYV